MQGEIYDENKYRYPAFGGRYTYAFNQIVDDRPYKANQNHDLTLKIITPNSDEITDSIDEMRARIISGQNNCVLVVLPDDRAFLDEIRAAIQIEKFIRFDATNAVTKYEQIKADKKIELREHNSQALLFLEEAMKAADIYVNGDKLQTTSKEISSRINEAMGKLASGVYHKLSYIDKPVTENDLRDIFKADTNNFGLDISDIKKEEKNQLAIKDVYDYIALNAARHAKTSMKTVMDRFLSAPYGFLEIDVQWLIAKLFKDGDIAFYVNSEPVTLISKGEDEILRYITRKEFLEKLMLDVRQKANDRQKKAVREVSKELFHITPSSDDDDAVMKSFLGYAKDLKTQLEKLEIRYSAQPKYPGKTVIENGKRMLIDISGIQYSAEFFSEICNKQDDYFDFAEDYEHVKKFFEGEQITIFDKAIKLMKIYDDSKTFVSDKKVESIVAEIESILKKASPYSEIFKLPAFLDEFSTAYVAILTEMEEPVLNAIKEARKRVFEDLDSKSEECREKLSSAFTDKFNELTDKAEHCNNIAVMQNIKVEADALKIRCLNEIAETENALLAKKAEEVAKNSEDDSAKSVSQQPVKKQKKQKSISVKSITSETTWRIENVDDIERYIDDLKSKLISKIEEDTIINVEF